MLDKFQGKWRIGLLLAGLLVVLTAGGVFLFHPGAAARANTSTALWPAVASPGGTILVTGSGFPSQERVKVYFQAPDRGVINAVTNATGAFSVPLTVPSTYIPGTAYYVHVNSEVYNTQMLFNFAKLNISLSNPTTKPTFGSPTSFTGMGFKPNEPINLAWNCATGNLNAGTALAGSDGSFTTLLTMPSIPYAAQCKLVATGQSSSFSASSMLTETPGIVYDPSSAPDGAIVHVKGGSFAGNELVNVSFLGSPMTTVKTDPSGSFTTSFTVPNTDQIGYQDNAIVAAGTLSGAKAKGGFNKQPKITIAPNHGGPGTRIKVSGKNFTHKGTVRIYFVVLDLNDSKVTRTLVATVKASNNGTFSVTITAPKVLGDVNLVVAVDAKTGATSSAPFVTKPKKG